MNERKHKHLDFIQATIIRMGVNSFLIKGWGVTLVAALFALTAKESNFNFILVSYIPVVIFWILDSYYLGIERQYRKLYDEVSKKEETNIDYCMNAKKYQSDNCWYETIFSISLLMFYFPLIIVMIIVMFILIK